MTLEHLKRLELLKTLIALEEKELLLSQVEKLEDEVPEKHVQEIAEAVRNFAYGDAVRRIDEILQESTSLQHYEDPEIKAFQLELRILEEKWAEMQDQKSEYDRQINAFHIRYQQELGSLISKLMYLRKEHLREEAKNDETRQTEFEEAEKDYEEHQRVFEEIGGKILPELNEEELEELKNKFRKAAKLCHPDTAAEEIREQSTEWFGELTDAYESHDLEKVKSIRDKLEHGGKLPRESEFTADKVRLKGDIEKLRKKMKEMEKELDEIKNSESWGTISELGENWESYFEGKKAEIQYEIQNLQQKEANQNSSKSP